jgi:hypothetical protein
VKNEILQHLAEKRNGFTESEIHQLEQLAVQFPYFSGAHILLSMAFGENNDHRRVVQIGATAARVSSRSSLKSLTTPFLKISENFSPTIETATTAIADIILTEENTIVSHEDNTIHLAENTEETSIAHISQIREIVPIENNSNELLGLQTGILVEAIQSSIELEVDPGENGRTITEENDVILSTYTAWLLQRAHSMEAPDLTHETSIFTEDTEHTHTSDAAYHEAPPHNDKRPATNTNWSVIDRFIETEPQIVKGKVGSYNSGDQTRGSFKEEDDFYTETMAKLLAQQGKVDKARWVFKKLMTLYPEKSIYFAAQLKNLESIKNK